jgi:ABC-type dipeptide/oligopeptide/nickel transport system permease component
MQRISARPHCWLGLITFADPHRTGDAAQVIAGPDATARRSKRSARRGAEPAVAGGSDSVLAAVAGDLGQSYMLGRSVLQAIGERMPSGVTSLYALC